MLAVHHKTPDDPERLLDHTIARILQKRDAPVAVGQPALGCRGPADTGPPALGYRWGRRHWATVGAAALGCAVFRHSAAGATRWAAVGLHGDRAPNRKGVSVCVRARARVCVRACVGNCVAFRAGRAFFNAHRALC
jgi:hypothetical protein